MRYEIIIWFLKLFITCLINSIRGKEMYKYHILEKRLIKRIFADFLDARDGHGVVV